ncbi:hypothetical protein SOVF_147570 isoform B [Spinacia oleracea]|nr:hypothetical protein SOVF_147570 isoform B [Spinacia oleracea]
MQRDDYHFSSLSLVRSVSLFRTKARIESAWNSVNLYDVLTIIFDVHRHLSRNKNNSLGKLVLQLLFSRFVSKVTKEFMQTLASYFELQLIKLKF